MSIKPVLDKVLEITEEIERKKITPHALDNSYDKQYAGIVTEADEEIFAKGNLDFITVMKSAEIKSIFDKVLFEYAEEGEEKKSNLYIPDIA